MQSSQFAVLAGVASTLVLVATDPACAQAQPTPTSTPDSTSAPDSDASLAGIADIVVTAQKRSEVLQKTPAAVTVVSGASLTQNGISNLSGIAAVVPGARFQPEANATQVFLRGVGSNLDYANIEQSVSFNINGIYIPREGTAISLYDVERVEALPGPQGTLYGRSAIGGTVNLSFKRPTYELETGGQLEVGNYNNVHATLVQNVPIGSDLAIRAAADWAYHDGYMRSGAGNKKDLGVRIGILYEPNPDLQVYVWGYTAQKYGHSNNLVNKGFNLETGQYDEKAFLQSDPWNDLRTGALTSFAPFGPVTAGAQYYHNYVTGAQIDVSLGSEVTLSYIPSYFYLDSEIKLYWIGGLPAEKEDNYRQLTQELRLAGRSGRLEWLAGLYGYRQVNDGQNILLIDTPAAFYASRVLRNRLQGAAIFGQGTYSLTDRLRLTAGGRLSMDNRHGRGISVEDQITPYSYAKTFKRADYKLGAEYDVAPQVMAYATYQTGYQPGTYNEVASLPGRSNAVKAANLNAITGGFKARFFDNKLQINNEIFYYTYRDLYLQAVDVSKFFNPVFNAKKVTIPGNQLDIIYRPTRDDLISVSVSYVRARNKDFVTPDGANYNGLTPPYAADWTVSGSISHDFHIGSGYIRAAADARYESPYYADYVHNRGTKQAGYVMKNASITYFNDPSRYSFGFWIKNISNEAVISATAAAGIPGPATAFLQPPRTYGARFTFNY